MKRAALTILFFLLLGFITNIVVAWGCAVFGGPSPGPPPAMPLPLDWREKPDYHDRGYPLSPNDQQRITAQDSFFEGQSAAAMIYRLSSPWADSVDYTLVDPRPNYTYTMLTRFDLGVPCRAFRTPHDPRLAGGRSNGMPDQLRATTLLLIERPLDFDLLWSGFAINTIFYGAIFCGLWFIPRQTLRAIRRRRGRCAHCNYPRGASAVCPECGAQL